ncbi:MAG: hypothetical protein ACTSXO_09375, partial [Candidatus Heimdallarchaeota archaeon]
QLSSTWDPLVSYSAQIQIYFNPGAIKQSDRTVAIADPPTYPEFGYFEIPLLTSLYADFGQDVYFTVYVWVSNFDRTSSQCNHSWAITVYHKRNFFRTTLSFLKKKYKT